MKYGEIVRGRLDRRVNRFIAEVYIDGVKERVHVKNTGRLKELLYTNNEVLLEVSNNPHRETRFSLIAVAHNDTWINVDSQAPNRVAFEALKEGKITELGVMDLIRREVTYRGSRLDLYFEQGEQRGFIEVKGVTLQRDGVAMFPDAPTTRGTKHILELIHAVHDGYLAVILFVVQMKGCTSFAPNRDMDPDFADALQEASRQGVQIIAYDSVVTENELVLDRSLPVET